MNVQECLFLPKLLETIKHLSFYVLWPNIVALSCFVFRVVYTSKIFTRPWHEDSCVNYPKVQCVPHTEYIELNARVFIDWGGGSKTTEKKFWFHHRSHSCVSSLLKLAICNYFRLSNFHLKHSTSANLWFNWTTCYDIHERKIDKFSKVDIVDIYDLRNSNHSNLHSRKNLEASKSSKF